MSEDEDSGQGNAVPAAGAGTAGVHVPGASGQASAHGLLLDVLVLHAADAERAEAGGADQLQLIGSRDAGGLSPEPSLVERVRAATSLPIRVMLRLREGYGTDGGEVVRLKGLLSAYRQAGADGILLGFLNAHTDIDASVAVELVGEEPDFGWTFHQAVDSCISTDRAWRTLAMLPGLDQVLTAGSARGVDEGLDDLVVRARNDPFARSVILAGGGLLPEHVPWLARAGIRRFHIASTARPRGSWKAYVDAELVGTWRRLLDDTARHPQPARPGVSRLPSQSERPEHADGRGEAAGTELPVHGRPA